LECEGLLEQRPKLGTYVRVPDRREMRELFELRIYLEPHAAARAARRCRPGLLRRLDTAVEVMKQAARKFETASSPAQKIKAWHDHAAADRAFHEAIRRAAGNRRICKVLDDAGILSLAMVFPRDRPWIHLEQNPMLYVQTSTEHGAILDAIRRGKPRQAARAMRKHLVRGRRSVSDYFAWREKQQAADKKAPVKIPAAGNGSKDGPRNGSEDAAGRHVP
jgi:DNA-binding GntR family transcriptional regulator